MKENEKIYDEKCIGNNDFKKNQSPQTLFEFKYAK